MKVGEIYNTIDGWILWIIRIDKNMSGDGNTLKVKSHHTSPGSESDTIFFSKDDFKRLMNDGTIYRCPIQLKLEREQKLNKLLNN